MKTGHFSKNSKKNYICRICGKKHHISICEEKNKQWPDETPNTVVNLNHEISSKNVLLQSTVFQIENTEYLNCGTVQFCLHWKSEKVKITNFKKRDSDFSSQTER